MYITTTITTILTRPKKNQQKIWLSQALVRCSNFIRSVLQAHRVTCTHLTAPSEQATMWTSIQVSIRWVPSTVVWTTMWTSLQMQTSSTSPIMLTAWWLRWPVDRPTQERARRMWWRSTSTCSSTATCSPLRFPSGLQSFTQWSMMRLR